MSLWLLCPSFSILPSFSLMGFLLLSTVQSWMNIIVRWYGVQSQKAEKIIRATDECSRRNSIRTSGNRGSESGYMIFFSESSSFSLLKLFSDNSSIFIRCHAEQSETVLIRQEVTLTHSHPAGDEFGRPLWPHEVEKWKRCFQFLDFKRRSSNSMESSVFELVHVRASYDGLVLETSLILMNRWW